MNEQGQAAPKSNRRLLLIGCGAIALVVVCACVGLTVMISQASSQFDEGVAAMEAGDCETAVSIFQEVSSNFFATEESIKTPAKNHISTCNQFTELVAQQNSGDVSGALVGYDSLLAVSSGSPLRATIESQAQTVFTADPTQLATPATCPNLDNYLKRNWIPNLDTNLPTFYQACGQVYTSVGDYTNAVDMYQRFLTGYPSHPAYENIEQALAKAAVAEARAAGAGEIPAPQSIGGTGTGTAVVVIQNDSREQLSLIFSGPEARFETLEPCLECQDYTGSGPENCPELGQIGRYEMPPGTYEVVVKSISDSGVIPFTGSWELSSGEEYYSCFFLVTE